MINFNVIILYYNYKAQIKIYCSDHIPIFICMCVNSGGFVLMEFCPQGFLFRVFCPQGVLSSGGFVRIPATCTEL